MELKNGLGIKWPDGKRIALMVTFDFDVQWLRYSRNGRKPLGFADQSRGEYGPEEGMARILRILEKHGVKGTFFVPGRVVEEYPGQIREIDEAGHELAYHGWAHEDSLELTWDEEWENMERAEAAFLSTVGKKPVGARGCWNVTHEYTPEMLRKRGYTYSSVMKTCDFAYLYPEEGEAPLVELPTEHSFDDYTYFFFTFNSPFHRSNYPIDYVFAFWKDAFDELAEEGDKIMVLKLHPQLIGRASRAVLLDRFLAYAKENGAWIVPCAEAAGYVAANTTAYVQARAAGYEPMGSAENKAGLAQESQTDAAAGKCTVQGAGCGIKTE